MKFGFFSLIVLTLLAIGSELPIKGEVVENLRNTNKPRINFTETTYNFGKVVAGPELKHSFRFKNDGDAILSIIGIQTSCGCTGATTNNKTNFESGEEGEVTVTFNSQGRMGEQTKTIIVQTNDDEQSQITLTITCNIVQE